MSRAGQQVSHVNDGLILVLDLRQHHGVCMPEYKADIEVISERNTFLPWNELQLSAFLYRQDIFLQERGFFPVVRFGGPIPMFLVAPETGIFKSRHQFVTLSFYTAATVIE